MPDIVCERGSEKHNIPVLRAGGGGGVCVRPATPQCKNDLCLRNTNDEEEEGKALDGLHEKLDKWLMD